MEDAAFARHHLLPSFPGGLQPDNVFARPVGRQPDHAITPSFLSTRAYRTTPKEKECLERAMFFESNRSSRDGMIAVGTVVMNRLRSGNHGSTICQVVGEP